MSRSKTLDQTGPFGWEKGPQGDKEDVSVSMYSLTPSFPTLLHCRGPLIPL